MGDLPDPTRTLYFFSLIIVKSLQLRERRQIVEPRKYCLVRVIVLFFFACVFSIFLFLTGWEFWIYSLQTAQEENIRRD